jgi:broad specificity phosphatase PhoE
MTFPQSDDQRCEPSLLFIRHGASTANLLRQISNRGYQHGLTKAGCNQVTLVATRLKAFAPGKILTSPLRRAVETAQILAEELAVPYSVTDALREYDCGILEGRSDHSAWQAYDRIARAWIRGEWSAKPYGGESLLEMRKRFVPFVRRLTEDRRTTSTTALVGHGGLYRFMLPLVLDNVDLSFSLANPIGHTCLIQAQPRSQVLHCLQWCGHHSRESGPMSAAEHRGKASLAGDAQ